MEIRIEILHYMDLNKVSLHHCVLLYPFSIVIKQSKEIPLVGLIVGKRNQKRFTSNKEPQLGSNYAT